MCSLHCSFTSYTRRTFVVLQFACINDTKSLNLVKEWVKYWKVFSEKYTFDDERFCSRAISTPLFSHCLILLSFFWTWSLKSELWYPPTFSSTRCFDRSKPSIEIAVSTMIQQPLKLGLGFEGCDFCPRCRESCCALMLSLVPRVRDFVDTWETFAVPVVVPQRWRRVVIRWSWTYLLPPLLLVLLRCQRRCWRSGSVTSNGRQQLEVSRSKNVKNRQLIFKRAEQYIKEYRSQVLENLIFSRVAIFFLVSV
jgi:hypothetical protein